MIKKFWHPNWTKMVKISNAAINFSDFFVQKLLLWSSLRKSYSICQENSSMVKFWQFKSDFWLKLTVRRGFWPKAAMNLPNFCYGTSLIFESIGEPIILCLVNEKMNLKFWHQNFLPVFDPFLVKNDHFCTQIRFLTINLVTVHQNFM